MFTDRFIELPTQLYNSEEAELTNKKSWECPSRDITCKLNPFKIESYRPYLDDSEPDVKKAKPIYTRVIMESGDTWLIYLPVSEFEKRLNQFHNNDN